MPQFPLLFAVLRAMKVSGESIRIPSRPFRLETLSVIRVPAGPTPTRGSNGGNPEPSSDLRASTKMPSMPLSRTVFPRDPRVSNHPAVHLDDLDPVLRAVADVVVENRVVLGGTIAVLRQAEDQPVDWTAQEIPGQRDAGPDRVAAGKPAGS